ncbi:lectin c-type domain containing protein [Plakobranchus ocellatus]|uniref:Lectin c-type domain containing protein n=1 Tax=Plakobranchus ocellatus TaxID=259542 RepID=A0AAV4DR31_9GAST|nr:lectin c-type domain containing protein [Plakobranchus ocellatus]
MAKESAFAPGTTVLSYTAASNMFGIFPLLTGIEAQNRCRNGWKFFRNSCYGFGHERMTWPEAEQMCVLYEGSLAEIQTKEENDFLKSMLRNNTILNRIYGAWIGGTDIFTEGTWEWAGTKELINEFQDWGPNEPNSVGGDGSKKSTRQRVAEMRRQKRNHKKQMEAAVVQIYKHCGQIPRRDKAKSARKEADG